MNPIMKRGARHGYARILRRAALLLAAAWAANAGAASLSDQEIARPEGARHFLLATPGQSAAGKRPLVIVLHGHAGSAAQVFGKNHINAPMQQWLDIADREHLLVAAPDGLKGSDNRQGWNDCRADAGTNPQADDVGFIAALIDKLAAEQNVDRTRVYVIGMSNGGGMAYRLATEMAPRLAAVAAVSALWPAKSLCAAPTQPLPVMIVHGTADKIAPYNGGEVGSFLLRGRGTTISVADTVALWRNLDKLGGAPVDTVFAHRESSDRTSAQRSVWGADPQGLQVEFIKIDKGGHAEPSIRRRMQWMYTALLGAQNGDVEIAEEAWNFFKDKRAAAAP